MANQQMNSGNAGTTDQGSADRGMDAGKEDEAGQQAAANLFQPSDDPRERFPDEKPNNGSRLQRARDIYYDDAPGHDKALHKLEAQARQLVKPSRQGSGHTSTSVLQSTGDEQSMAGDADEQNSGSVKQAKKVGGKSASKAGGKKVVAKKAVAKKAVGKATVGKAAASKKTVAKKAVGKKVVAKKAVAKTVVAKKAVAKKAVAKKTVAKKVVSKKAVAKKAGAKKAVSKKVVAKKAVAKKTAAKKTVGKSAQRAGGKRAVKAKG